MRDSASGLGNRCSNPCTPATVLKALQRYKPKTARRVTSGLFGDWSAPRFRTKRSLSMVARLAVYSDSTPEDSMPKRTFSHAFKLEVVRQIADGQTRPSA